MRVDLKYVIVTSSIFLCVIFIIFKICKESNVSKANIDYIHIRDSLLCDYNIGEANDSLRGSFVPITRSGRRIGSISAYRIADSLMKETNSDSEFGYVRYENIISISRSDTLYISFELGFNTSRCSHGYTGCSAGYENIINRALFHIPSNTLISLQSVKIEGCAPPGIVPIPKEGFTTEDSRPLIDEYRYRTAYDDTYNSVCLTNDLLKNGPYMEIRDCETGASIKIRH